MTGLVSIITPAYKAESMICNAVSSVLAQTYSQWEMIIIADDDHDYQATLAENGLLDPRLRFLKTAKVQSGPNVTRNLGLEIAKGEWIAPLDADDVYYPERLEKLVEAGQATGLALDNVKIVGEYIDERIVIEGGDNDNFGFEDSKKSLVPLVFLFHRRHVHQGWDEDIIRGADTMFNLRAIESAGTATFVSEPYHEYRVHNQSMCHAEGSSELFIEAYGHTLARLKSDGLGFKTQTYRDNVIAMIQEKYDINQAFLAAVKKGYEGNYQSFVQSGEFD